MKGLTYFIISIIIVLLACKNKADDKKTEYIDQAKRELIRLNEKYDSALVSSDTAGLNRLYAPEFTYTTPEGQVRTKEQQLYNLSSGGLKLEIGKSDEVDVLVYDSTAVVCGRFLGKGIFKENIIDIKERYTTVWVKRNGQWRLVKEQGTFIQ